MTKNAQGVTMRTAELVAIAKWASSDKERTHLNMVVFRNEECIACDGHRMVRVPCPTNGAAFGVHHQHIATAAAAQRAGAYDGDRSLVLVPHPTAKPWPNIAIWVGPVDVPGSVRLMVPLRDLAEYPSHASIEKLLQRCEPGSGSIAGHAFNPRFLADLEEVHAATIDGWIDGWGDGRDREAVTIESWAATGVEPVVFRNARGVRFLVMPMRSPRKE
jgi:hypothetical protein